jgi:aminoglycoside phosphotransferase (APT) family kinase protein
VLGERLAVGASAEVYALDATRVVKLFVPQYAYAAPMELDRTRAVFEAGVVCPEVFELIEVDGRVGIVMERVDGENLLVRAFASEAERGPAAQLLADLHIDLHTRTAPALPHWSESIAKVPAAIGELMRAMPDGDRLFHGDFHPGNVIMAERGPVIVDWPNARLAHPAADVARSVMLMQYQGAGGAYPVELDPMRRDFTEAYVAAYLARGTLTFAEVERCLPLFAAGILREQPDNAHRDVLARIAAGETS